MNSSTTRTVRPSLVHTPPARSLARAAGTAGSFRRPGAAAIAAGAAALAALPAFGQVAGERVVHGSASFQRQGTLTTITASNNAIINYNSFNVRANETVRFVQPDAASRVLNRITTSVPTHIDGTITANGKVYIVNPAGIFFAKGAKIDTAGLYAAAGTITNQDFIRGIDRFVSAPGGRVINEGTINAPIIGLAGEQVANFGALAAPEGAVMMVSGDTVLMGEHDGHVYAKIETRAPAGPDAGAPSKSSPAPAPRRGRFGAGDMYSLAVWNSGTVRAEKAVMEAERGAVGVAGTVDVSDVSPGGKGGSVEILGPAVAVQGATIEASGDAGGGQVLLGGNFQGKGPQRNAERTTVSADSEIRADALTEGDGGRVIVWSDRTTGFDGRISARGGTRGGDGGFAEISSKEVLRSNVNVDLGAPGGASGTLLFDPAFIRIDGGTNDGSDHTNASNSSLRHDAGSNVLGLIDFGDFGVGPGNAGDSAGNPFIIFESEIEGTNADIILRATQQVTTSGNFTGADVVLVNDRSLTIETDGSTGAGVIDLTTSGDGTNLLFRTLGAGTITIRSTALLNTCDITVGRLQTNGGDIDISTTNGSVNLTNSVLAGSGTVRLSGSTTVTQVGGGSTITAGAVGAAAGTGIALDAASNSAGVFAARLTGAGTVAFRNQGQLVVGTVTGVGGSDAAGIDAPAGTVKLRSDNSFIQQTAPIVADTLGAVTSLALTLADTTNDVNTFAGQVGTAALSFADVDGFSIGAVTGIGGTDVFGVNAAGQSATLRAGTGATVTQTDPVVAGTLTLLGAATFDLTGSAANNVASLQAGLAPGSAVDSVSYLDSNSFSIVNNTLVSNDLDARAATGTITTSGTISVSGDMTLTADDIDVSSGTFQPGASSVLTLQPFTAGTEVHVADGVAMGLNFSQADLNNASPFPSLVIGSATGTAMLTFGGTTAFAQHITLRSGGAGGSVTLQGTAALSTGANRNIAIQAGTGNGGLFTMPAGATVNSGGGNISITADAVALGDPNSIQGTGSILLQPASPGRAIQVGGVDDPARFSIDPTEFGALQNGFSKIVIGRDDSNAASSIDSITANDPLVFQTPAGGTMDVNSLTAAGGVALVTGGTLNVNQAFTATNAEITLVSGADLTISNPIDAGTGTVRLVSGGLITQTVGGAITAGALGVRAAGAVDMQAIANAADIFAAVDSLAGAGVTFTNSGPLTIGLVGPETLNNGTTYFAAANGVTTNAAPFTLGAGGDIVLNAGVSVGVASPNGIVRIASPGSVTQTGGSVSANRLGVSALGDILLTSATNQVAFAALDASLSGTPAQVQFRVANGTAIDEVTPDGAIFAGATGVQSAFDGDVLINSGTGGMTLNQPIVAGEGTVRLASGATVFQAGSGTITAGALGVRASGTVSLPLANSTPGTLTAMTLAADAGTGDFQINLPDRDLVIGSVGASGGLFAATSGITTTGTARFVVPAGGVTQSAPIVAGSLGVRSADAISLTNASNNVGILAIDVINAAQPVAFRDTDGFTVGSVGPTGIFAQTNGVITAGDVSLRAGAGTLQIDRTIDVGGSADIRLVSGQGVSQATTPGEAIIARAMGVNAAGDVLLLNADNDVATFAGTTSAGVLKIIDRSGLDVGSLAADTNGFALTNGMTTSGGDGLIDTTGPLSIEQSINVGSGTMRIVTTGGVTQDPGTSLTAAALGVVAGGDVVLDEASNNVDAVAGLNSGVGSAFTLVSTGPLAVGTVNFDTDDGNFPSTTGITTTNGPVSLTSIGGTQSVNEAIDSGSGGVLLSAGGVVTINAPVNAAAGAVRITTTAGGVNQTGGDIVAALLGVRAAGDVTLNRVDGANMPVNNVTTFAATTGSSGGRVAYRDVDAFDVGAVGAIAGFTAVNGVNTTGNAYLQSGGALTQTQGVVATLFGVRAGGPITLNAVDGSFVPLNNVATFAATSTGAGAAIVYRDSNAFTVGAVPGVAGFGAATGVTTAGNGDSLLHSGGLLTLANNINVGTGTLRLVGAQGVTQSGGSIVADALGVRAAGDIVLNSTSNDVETFAAAATSGNVSFADADDLIIGSVAASGTFTPAVNGVTASGTVSIQSGASGAGNLSFDPGITVGGGEITLRAGDGLGGNGTGAMVDALTNAPTFAGAGGAGTPTLFAFRQDADVADTNLPDAAQFQGADAPQAYTIVSDDGGVSINQATKVNGTDLTLSGTSVSVPPDLNVRSLSIDGPATISSVDATGTVTFNNDITFGNSVTIEADEINFGGNVIPAGPGVTLTLRQKALNRTINLGSTGSDPLDPIQDQLDLTALEIGRIQSGFAAVLIGRADATGLLQVLSPVTFNSPVTLDMRGPGASISIAGRLAGADNVPITILGSGATTTISQDIVTRAQPILIDDTVIIAGTPTLDTTDGGGAPGGAAVTITGTTDADAASRSLTVNAGTDGAVALQGAVGTGALPQTQALGSLSATGATITLPLVITTGAQTYTGAATLGGNLTSTGTGAISFSGPVTLGAATLRVATAGGAGDNAVFGGTVNGASALTVDVGDDGVAQFDGDVGGTTALTSLAVDGGTFIGTSAVTFMASGGGVAFNGDINGPGNALTVAAGSGTTTLGGDVGGTGALGAFTINGPTVLGSDVAIDTGAATTTLAGAVTGAGNALAVTAGSFVLGGNVGTSGAPIGAFTVNAPLTLSTSVTVNSGTAAAAFNGPIGGAGNSLTVNAGSVALGGDAGAGGPLGAFTLNAPTTLTAPTVSVATAGSPVTFNGTLNGASALSIAAGAGSVTFGGAVGGVTPLSSLAVTGGQIGTGTGVTTTGAQMYTGPTRFGGNVAVTQPGAGVTVNGPLSLSGVAVNVSTAGASSADSIAINGTVDGGSILTLNAGAQGNINVTGALGGTTAPASLAATGNFISLFSAATTGDQSYSGVTSLSSGATANRLFFYGETVLGNAAAESTYTSSLGVRFVGGLYLFGDAVINAGAGQAYFHGVVETAQTATAGVQAAENRSLTLLSSLTPGLITSGTDPHTDPNFTAYVNAPFLFNANVGGDHGSPTDDPSQTGEIGRMLESITFGAASGVPTVATIVQTKGHFTFPQAGGGQGTGGTPDPDINSWFVNTNPALRMGGFTIPPNFDFNPALASATTRMNVTEGFDMGGGNKFLSVGNMWIFADAGNIVIGDLASLANINVRIGAVERQYPGVGDVGPTDFGITIRQRGAGTVASNQFSNENGVVNITSQDKGVDIVSLNNIAFSVVPAVAGDGTARFSLPLENPDGSPIPGRVVLLVDGADFFGNMTVKGQLERSNFKNANVDRNLLLPAEGNGGTTQGDVFPNLTAFGMGLDLQSEGAPRNTDIATALAGALPQAEAAAVQSVVSLGSNVLEDLLQLGLQVKEPKDRTTGEYTTEYLEDRALSISGRTDYNDVPPYAKPDPSRQDYRVSIDRLSADSVRSVLDAYYALVGEDNTARAERKSQIQSTIGASWEKYVLPIEEEGGTPDGVGFRRFVESDPAEAQTLQYLDQIATLLREIDRLALSPVELRAPKLKTLSELRGELMSPEQLEEAALGVPVDKPGESVALLSSAGGEAR